MGDYRETSERIAGHLGRQLFFIGGAPKSGTTWLMKALNGHSSISCDGEAHFGDILLPFLQEAINRYNQARSQKLFEYPLFGKAQVQHLFQTAMALLLDQQIDGANICCIGEKTPRNVHSFGPLSGLLPQAKFLHIIRDGRDVAVSAWFHNQRVQADASQREFERLSQFLPSAIQRWMSDISAARQFGQRQPNRLLEIRYEDLIDNFDVTMQPVLEFLGVFADVESLQRCRDAGSFKRLSSGRESGEEDSQSHFRKGVSGDWKNHFDDECRRYYSETAGEMSRALGYVDGL